MPFISGRNVTRLAALLIPLTISGCVLAPHGTTDEQAKQKSVGVSFETPIDKRDLPDLPDPATWRDVLRRALLASGELESSYFEWKAALQRIPQVANYPNTNLAPSFSYMFSGERLKSWDRTTISAGFDPSRNLSFPTKVAQAGKLALDEARSAGEKFRAKKFEIQRNVLSDYLDLALMEEKIRIQKENVEWLNMLSESAQNRVIAGGMQTDLLRAQTEYRLADNELATMHSEHYAMKARLNGMLARDPRAPLEVPSGLPEPRPIAADDAKLIAVAVDENPELAKLARDVQGREDAITLAKMDFIPDINPTFAITGDISQVAGAMVMLPTTIPEIRGRIDEARAMLRADEAMLRQTRSERAASFVASLYVLRNSERQTRVFEETILPRAEQVLTSMRQNYSTGTSTFLDLIEAQRTVLDIRVMIAEAKIEREKQLAELEALAGLDIETLAPPTTAPTTAATQPTTEKSR